jgi:hypothetical protein
MISLSRFNPFDEIYAVLLFLVPVFLVQFSNEATTLYFFFILVSFYYVKSKGELRFHPKIFYIVLVAFIFQLIVSYLNNYILITPFIFLFLWSLFIKLEIRFDPHITIIPILLGFYTFGFQNMELGRFSFFLEPNYSALLLLIIQLLLIKNARYYLYLVTFPLVFLLASRMAIASNILIIAFISLSYLSESTVVKKIIRPKIVFFLSIIFTLFLGLFMSKYTQAWSGYNYSLVNRVMNIKDLSNAKRINSYNYALNELILHPIKIVTGVNYYEYKRESFSNNLDIPHNFYIGMIMSFGASAFIIFYLLFTYISLVTKSFINNLIILIWIFCSCILNPVVVISYYGVLVIIILSISDKQKMINLVV